MGKDKVTDTERVVFGQNAIFAAVYGKPKEEEEEAKEQPKSRSTASFLDSLIACGDTPSMACDNFDHLWVYGK